VVLAGRPQALRGHIPVTNDGADDVVVSRLRVRTTAAATGSVDATAASIVPAGSTQRVPMSLALDERTPAGEYDGEIQIAGEVRRVVLHVSAIVDLDVTPTRLHITPSGDNPVTVTLVFANRGNVSIRLPSVARAPMDEAKTLALRLGAKPTMLEPGEVRTIHAEVTLPADVDPARRYDVTVAVGPNDLTVVVLPTADETSSAPSTTPPRRF
jgi:hypothetical protein